MRHLWMAIVPVGAMACMPVAPLPLRADLTSAAATPAHLDGVRAAVGEVHDQRQDRAHLGRRRDGLARVPQWSYGPTAPIELTVRSMLTTALRNAGAVITPAPDADVRVDVDVLDLDVTDDGFLAGTETFGRVAFHVRVRERSGAVLGDHVRTLDFGDPDRADPGMLGDAMYRVFTEEVAAIQRTGSVVARTN
jgi:hypothetical protein